jgi:hypothetical protein
MELKRITHHPAQYFASASVNTIKPSRACLLDENFLCVCLHVCVCQGKILIILFCLVEEFTYDTTSVFITFVYNFFSFSAAAHPLNGKVSARREDGGDAPRL